MGRIATVGLLFRYFVENFQPTVPISLHRDPSTEHVCLEAMGAGFTSVMFDGSKCLLRKICGFAKNLPLFVKNMALHLKQNLVRLQVKKTE